MKTLLRVLFIREQTAQIVLNLDEHKPSKKGQASSLENPNFSCCEQIPKGKTVNFLKMYKQVQRSRAAQIQSKILQQPF